MSHPRPSSGKPPGRPRGSTSKHKLELQALAREYTEVALRTLVEICRRGDTDKARVDAADKLLDRGWGKPVQAIHSTGDAIPSLVTLDVERLSTASLEQILEARREEDV